MAFTAAAASARSLASRSVHIKIHPTARTLLERREVLRVLERFGEVEMFRSLKYDPASPVPNAFLSILSTEEAAKAAIEASPIRYRIIADIAGPTTEPPTSAVNASRALSSSHVPKDEVDQEITRNINTATDSIFELRISPSAHPHALTIQSSPLHGPFVPVCTQRSPIAADLANRIPDSIAKSGLIDWDTDSARVGGGAWRLREGGKAGWGRGAGIGWEETKPWRVRDREKEERENGTPAAMRGLLKLGEKGQRTSE